MKILISPLDWGLGHATRMIPLINAFLAEGHDVHIAASGLGLKLLKKNYDRRLEYHPLESLDITYSGTGKNQAWNLLRQLPGFLKKVFKDRKGVLSLHKHHRFDIIISDNRYGIRVRHAYNIFVTHQLLIRSGVHRVIDKTLYRLHLLFLKKYQEIWVVDHPLPSRAIVPDLSHPAKKTPQKVRYIGHLSQFENSAALTVSHMPISDILVLLSGPEPLRSMLFDKLLRQALALEQYNFVFITGSDHPLPLHVPEHIKLQGLVDNNTVREHIRTCDLVVCRSGYSTVMDLMVFGKKGIMIPTPGQAEQEYIANVLSDKCLFYNASQESIDLSSDIEKAVGYNGFQNDYKDEVNTLFRTYCSNIML